MKIFFLLLGFISTISQAATQCFPYRGNPEKCVKFGTVVDGGDRDFVFGHSECTKPQGGGEGSRAPSEYSCEAEKYGAVYSKTGAILRLMNPENMPRARYSPYALYTPQGIFVWGGLAFEQHGIFSYDVRAVAGAMYLPNRDQWVPISSINAPPSESGDHHVWRGRNDTFKSFFDYTVTAEEGTILVTYKSRTTKNGPETPHRHRYFPETDRWIVE